MTDHTVLKSDAKLRTPFSTSRGSIYCGLGVLILGMLVLFGWYLNVPLLIQVHPSFVPMQYNTALGFLLCGAGLICLNFNRSHFSLGLGSITLLIGGLTLIQYIFSVDLGLDQLFMDHYITVKTHHPGRMAPNTALCFSLSGASLIVAGLSKKTPKAATFLAIFGGLILTLSSVAAVGYVVRLETAYGWGNLTRMALHTSVGFLVLGTGTLFLARLNAKKLFLISRWVPILITLFLTTITLLFFQASISQKNDLIRQKLRTQVEAFKKEIDVDIKSRILDLSRMGSRLENRAKMIKSEWEEDAKEYLKHFPDYRALSWVDSSYIVRWIVPLKGNETAQGLDLKLSKDRLNTLEKTKTSGQTAVSPVIDLVLGEKGFLIMVPLHKDKQFAGLIKGVVSFERFLNKFIETTLKKDFSFQIFQNGKEIFTRGKTTNIKMITGLLKVL